MVSTCFLSSPSDANFRSPSEAELEELVELELEELELEELEELELELELEVLELELDEGTLRRLRGTINPLGNFLGFWVATACGKGTLLGSG